MTRGRDARCFVTNEIRTNSGQMYDMTSRDESQVPGVGFIQDISDSYFQSRNRLVKGGD